MTMLTTITRAVLGGRKAHWALVTGFVLVVDATEDITDVKTVTSDQNKNVHILTVVADKDKEKLNRLIANKTGKLLLVARQSKSRCWGSGTRRSWLAARTNSRQCSSRGQCLILWQ